MIAIATLLSAVVRHQADLIIISVLLIFNGVVGFWREFQASNAVEQLKKGLALKARVLRDRKWQELTARGTGVSWIWSGILFICTQHLSNKNAS